MRIYYTYKWLREDGTPYYIGKGKGRRAWTIHKRKNVSHYPPEGRVEIIMDSISEEEALTHEVWLIALYGRKSEGGLLINSSAGGQGPSNARWTLTDDTKSKMKVARAKRPPASQKTRDRIRDSKTGVSWGKHTKTTKEKQSKTQTENWKDNDERREIVSTKMAETNSKLQPCPDCGKLMNAGNLTQHIRRQTCKRK
jgi:hypothetical protein